MNIKEIIQYRKYIDKPFTKVHLMLSQFFPITELG